MPPTCSSTCPGRTPPEGQVSFIVTNSGTRRTHEFVVLPAPDSPWPGSFPIVGLRGRAEPVRRGCRGRHERRARPGADDATRTPGDGPGHCSCRRSIMAAGHYAVVCNLPGHYVMGMHQDLIGVHARHRGAGHGHPGRDRPHPRCSSRCRRPTAPQGPVSFVVTNRGRKTHEFVVLRPRRPPPTSRSSRSKGGHRIDEDAKGVVNVGETGDMEAGGTTMMLSIDMKPGHYAVVCNLPGHYAMGMHQDFSATPAEPPPSSRWIGETDPTHMYIHLYEPYVPQGKVTSSSRIRARRRMSSWRFRPRPRGRLPHRPSKVRPTGSTRTPRAWSTSGRPVTWSRGPAKKMSWTARALRRRVQPPGALRDGHASGLLGHARHRRRRSRSPWARPTPPRCSSRCGANTAPQGR